MTVCTEVLEHMLIQKQLPSLTVKSSLSTNNLISKVLFSNLLIFFGFPNREYVNQSGIDGINVPFGSEYSQNRRFNCKDCGETGIDMERSTPPYVVVCN